LFREVTAIYSDNHTKPINMLCGQNIDFLHFSVDDTSVKEGCDQFLGFLMVLSNCRGYKASNGRLTVNDEF
jgi:hypothetical protein